MRTQFACWLDGVGLQDLDPRIYVADVEESPPETHRRLRPRLRSGGMYAEAPQRRRLQVTVRFLIHESDPVRRKRLCSQVSAWAENGRILTVSDRPHQQLRVQCETLPAVSSSLKWTDPLSVTFSACAFPWWEEVAPVSLTLQSSGSAVMHLPGTAPYVPADVTSVNTSGSAVSALTVQCGETALELTGLTWNPGEALHVFTDASGLMCITAGGRDVCSCRTPQSSDWLLLPCSAPAAVSVTCDKDVSVTVSAKGAWL